MRLLRGGARFWGAGATALLVATLLTPGPTLADDAAAEPTSTEHCVEGRQFDPDIWAFAPPCGPSFAGDNGGPTYRGVTENSVRVVIYDADVGSAVRAIRGVQGAPTSDQMQSFMGAAEEFVNSSFELSGRELELSYWRGQCQASPPDYTCLRNEMRRIVQERQPFWVIWNSWLASPAFDELSQLKVLNSGGWGFRGSFNHQRRPYRWELLMDGTTQAHQAAEWWCDRLEGYDARYAGEPSHRGPLDDILPPIPLPPLLSPAAPNDLRDDTRVLGVLASDDPENKLAVAEFKNALSPCGARVEHEYYYAHDFTTSGQQRREAIDEMRQPPESTTIACFCDPAMSILLYQSAEEQGYYPEHLVVGSGFMDIDPTAQSYDHTLPPEGRQFENAFGLAQQPASEADGPATRIWQATGRTGAAPYPTADADWEYYGMVASLIQMAGPNLTPLSVEANASTLSFQASTDDRLNGRSFDPAAGDFTWFDTMRQVYWSTEGTSPANGEPGTYVTMPDDGDVWFGEGAYPSGELDEIPAKPR